MSYTTLKFLRKKNHYLKKEFLNKTIFYSVHPFAHIRQHYFPKYWGTNAWAVPPPQIFWGPSPQSPKVSAPGLTPMRSRACDVSYKLFIIHMKFKVMFNFLL